MAEESSSTITSIHVNRFNEESTKDFWEKFKEAESKSQQIIPITIDSFGGEVYAALAMNDIIRSTNKVVITTSVGKAMSCGLFLLAAGTPGYRFCSSNCSLMLHSVSSWTEGKVGDMQSDMKENIKLQKRFLFTMAHNCGKKNSYFLDIINSNMDRDIFMTPKEALKHNIIDKIGIPILKEKKEMIIEV